MPQTSPATSQHQQEACGKKRHLSCPRCRWTFKPSDARTSNARTSKGAVQTVTEHAWMQQQRTRTGSSLCDTSWYTALRSRHTVVCIPIAVRGGGHLPLPASTDTCLRATHSRNANSTEGGGSDDLLASVTGERIGPSSNGGDHRDPSSHSSHCDGADSSICIWPCLCTWWRAC